MVASSKCLLTFLAVFVVGISGHGDDANPGHMAGVCACSLVVLPENETGCGVYGVYGVPGVFADHLMPWAYAPSQCLKEYNVSYTDFSVEDLVLTCPNRNGTGSDVTAILDIFRGDTSTGNYLKSQYNEFFQLNNATGNYDWQAVIQNDNAQTVPCTGDASFCWQALNIYLSTSGQAGAEQKFICDELYKIFYAGASKEQSQIRVDICPEILQDGDPCYPLWLQIVEHFPNTSSVVCTGVGDGPGNYTVPAVCDGPPASMADNMGMTGASSSAFVAAAGWMGTVIVVLLSSVL